jgi:hypothetical protein
MAQAKELSMGATTRLRFSLLVAIACAATPAVAQSPSDLDLTAVGKDPRWKVAGRTTSIVDIKGKHALKVSEGGGMGVVWLDGYDFANGVIEVDVMGRSQPVQGSFGGDARRGVFPAIQLSRGRLAAAESRGAIRVRSQMALGEASIGAPGHVRTRRDAATRRR